MGIRWMAVDRKIYALSLIKKYGVLAKLLRLLTSTDRFTDKRGNEFPVSTCM